MINRNLKWRSGLGLTAGTAMATAMLLAGPALADTGTAVVKSLSANSFVVKSDGEKYTAPAKAGQPLGIAFQVFLDAERAGRIRSFEVYPKIEGEKFQAHGYKKVYPKKNRPKKVNTTVDVTIPANEFGEVLVGICNEQADELRSVGLSNAEIFAKNRTEKSSVVPALHYDMTLGAEIWSEAPSQVEAGPLPGRFEVICEKDGSGTGAFAQNVVTADLEIEETATIDGACKLELEGMIVTQEPNQQVKFRYEDMSGKKSALHTVQTNASKIANFNHSYDLAGTGRKNGSIKIAIHGETTESSWQYYDVSCRKNAPNGLAGNGTQGDGVGPGAGDKAVEPETVELLLPDLMATPLGLSFAGSKRPWGSTAVITNPGHAAKTGVGPQKKHCRFEQVAFRPFNKGDAASGNFKMRVFRDSSLVEQQNFDLASHAGLPSNSGWHKFNLDLPQGRSTIKVALDTGKVVTESDETNNVYTVDVDVKFPCASGGTHLGANASGAGDDDENGGRKRKFGHRLENKGGIKQLKPMLTQ